MESKGPITRSFKILMIMTERAMNILLVSSWPQRDAGDVWCHTLSGIGILLSGIFVVQSSDSPFLSPLSFLCQVPLVQSFDSPFLSPLSFLCQVPLVPSPFSPRSLLSLSSCHFSANDPFCWPLSRKFSNIFCYELGFFVCLLLNC